MNIRRETTLRIYVSIATSHIYAVSACVRATRANNSQSAMAYAVDAVDELLV